MWRAAHGAGCPTGLLLQLLLFSPPGDPLGGPHLPSPTACLGFLCFSLPSARKAQARCTSVFAGHGIGCRGSSGAERLCPEGQREPAATGRAVGGIRGQPVPHLPGRNQQHSLRGLVLPSLLLWLHPAVGRDETCVPTLQEALRSCPAGAASR